ncbi:hypothetical protein JYB32_24035, partial [Burkholderia cenocepacia]|nr:hypothetical protein [Burkholderia cenocepacia]
LKLWTSISSPFNNLVLRRPVESTQYCSGLFQDTLKAYGMRSSMSRRGDCWDNEVRPGFAKNPPHLGLSC